ncbi:MAG: hypothetical protein ABIM49_02365 [candidate division WOR-3 bacterium]
MKIKEKVALKVKMPKKFPLPSDVIKGVAKHHPAFVFASALKNFEAYQKQFGVKKAFETFNPVFKTAKELDEAKKELTKDIGKLMAGHTLLKMGYKFEKDLRNFEKEYIEGLENHIDLVKGGAVELQVGKKKITLRPSRPLTISEKNELSNSIQLGYAEYTINIDEVLSKNEIASILQSIGNLEYIIDIKSNQLGEFEFTLPKEALPKIKLTLPKIKIKKDIWEKYEKIIGGLNELEKSLSNPDGLGIAIGGIVAGGVKALTTIGGKAGAGVLMAGKKVVGGLINTGKNLISGSKKLIEKGIDKVKNIFDKGKKEIKEVVKKTEKEIITPPEVKKGFEFNPLLIGGILLGLGTLIYIFRPKR